MNRSGPEGVIGQLRDVLLPPLPLQHGGVALGLRLRCSLHGQLNAQRDNAILVPTWFAGRHPAAAWLAGPGRALDTQRWCVVVVNALGNGESSSPSNHPALSKGAAPIVLSLADQVAAQAALLDVLGIEKLHAVVGRSMGAQMALQWACLWPQRAGRVLAFCGAPRTSPHNRLVLEGLAGILAQGLREGDHAGCLARAATVYAAWSVTPAFLQRLSSGVQAWADQTVGQAFAAFHPADLLSLVRCWQQADVAAHPSFGGRLDLALAAAQVPVLLVPIEGDQLFTPAEIEAAAALLPQARCVRLVSEWGHRAAAPGSAPDDIATLEALVRPFVDGLPAGVMPCPPGAGLADPPLCSG